MTQEIRITVDANLYYRNRPEETFDKDFYIRLWKSMLEDFIYGQSGADRKFINVKVDVIPHDNDRDYTEEDAEKHLYGEKRKTYADDFFEKFPNAPHISVGIPRYAKVPAVHFWDVYGLEEMEKHMENPLMAFGDTLAMGGISNDLWMKEKPEDDHA